MESPSETPGSVTFGRFRVLPHRRELLADGEPIKLGGRAFDVLLALIEARGAIVSKDALMARVWSQRVVEENNLQAQIVALRKAFGPERELIRTVSGRGYQFVGEISAMAPDREGSPGVGMAAPEPASIPPAMNLREPVSELIGREDELREILGLAAERRFVTLTGVGGIGKTRLAVAAARRLLPHFPDGVWLAEFSPLSDPGLVSTAVAAAVGLEIGGGEVSAQRVAEALGDRRMLLVLDTCEHVIDAAARLAYAILGAGPAVHIIATSREPLRAEGEWTFPVPPLPVTAGDAEREDASTKWGAVRLFIERARAGQPNFAPDPRLTAMIAAVCRRLDGIPLAIELAAARAAALGIEELARRLDDRFRLLTAGRRTALPRHQTLRATFDWSYELLTEPERVVLRRLASFAGGFSLEAASRVAASCEIAPEEVVNALANLVAKSLVVAEFDAVGAGYRLLDTTRAYALEKLVESGESAQLVRRHAEYFRDLFERTATEWEWRSAADLLADYGSQIDNVRAALEWAFSPAGDAAIGVALTVASERLWFSLSLIDEYRRRAELALASLKPGTGESTRQEMKLYAILSAALFNTRGPGPEANRAWTAVLGIAERLDDTEYRLRALWGLWYNHISNGECRAALALAETYLARFPNQADPADLLVGERMLGTSLYYLGDLSDARRHLEHMLSHSSAPLRWSHLIRFQFDLPVAARGTLARVLWLQGLPDQAMHMVRDNLEDAGGIDPAPSVSLYWALDAVCLVALAVGDHETAEHAIATLLDHSAKHTLRFWQALGHSYEGQALIRRGNVAGGVQRLRGGLDELRATKYVLRSPALLGALAEGMAGVGQLKEAMLAIDEALAQCECTDERWSMADLLRIRGELLLLQDAQAAEAAAQDHFRRALDWAGRQGALSLELRAATSLARLLVARGRSADAIGVLQPVYDGFTEGFGTADLKKARVLLDALH